MRSFYFFSYLISLSKCITQHLIIGVFFVPKCILVFSVDYLSVDTLQEELSNAHQKEPI